MRIKTFIMSSVLMLNSLNYSFADDARSGINFYSGTFDFSDTKKGPIYFVCNPKNKNLFADKVHFSNQGHELMSEILYDKIIQSLN